MATGKQLMALLATSSSLVSLAAAQNLATITPFPGADPVTVTAQYQVVPSCELSTTTVESTVTDSSTTSVIQEVQTVPLCTPSTFVSTAVPTYSNYVRGSTVVTSIEQPVTFNSADFTISASALPTPSSNATRNATNTVAGRRKRQLAGTVIDIKSYQDYDRIGALAIPNYDGSGLCTECGPDSAGALTQAYTVVSCSSTIGGAENCTTFDQTEIASPTSYSAPGGSVITTTTTNTFGPTATPISAMPGAGNPGGASPTGYGSYGSYGSYGNAGSGSGAGSGYGSYGNYGSYANVLAGVAPAPGTPYYAPAGSSPQYYPGPAGNPVPIAYPQGQSAPVPYPWTAGSSAPGSYGEPSVVTTTVFETITTTTTVPASTFTTTSMSTPANGGAPVTVTTTVTAPASTVTAPVTLTTTTTVTATPTNAAGNPLLCPQFDGQIIGSSTGATYLVQCGRAIVGTQITNVAKRQSNPTGPTVDVCINLCCQIDNCVAINLTPDGCDYFSSFTGTVVAVNVTALFQEACPAKPSSTSSISSTATANGTNTVSGTVSSTGVITPLPTSSLCPAFDGQPYTDDSGNVYTIDCNTAFVGTRIDTGMRRRQLAISISVCFDVCCGLDECVGVNYNPSGFCEYFSAIIGTTSAPGFIAGFKDTCGTGGGTTSGGISSISSTTSSSGSFITPTSTGSFATTSTTSSNGSFQTSSTTTSNGSLISSATTTTSLSPTATDAICPASDGQDVTDTSNNVYDINCDQAFTGTTIGNGLRRRQAASFSVCSDTCCRLTGCVGINFTPQGCEYFSAITGLIPAAGTIAAQQVTCANSSPVSSNTVSSGSTTTTGGSLVTSSTSTGGSFVTTSSSSTSTTATDGGIDTLTIPGGGPTVTIPTVLPTGPVTLPTITVPGGGPTVTLPTLDPTGPVSLPTLTISGVGTVTLPTLTLDPTDLPTATVSLPTVSITGLPTVTLPTLTIGPIGGGGSPTDTLTNTLPVTLPTETLIPVTTPTTFLTLTTVSDPLGGTTTLPVVTTGNVVDTITSTLPLPTLPVIGGGGLPAARQ